MLEESAIEPIRPYGLITWDALKCTFYLVTHWYPSHPLIHILRNHPWESSCVVARAVQSLVNLGLKCSTRFTFFHIGHGCHRSFISTKNFVKIILIYPLYSLGTKKNSLFLFPSLKYWILLFCIQRSSSSL